MSDSGGHIHLVLPDPVERAACFRLLARGANRVVRSFASADAWLEAQDGARGGILLLRWRQPGPTSGAALLDRIAGRGDLIAFVAAERLSFDEARAI
ncbi:MAG: helix-turn-helix transcriptional regulator, partial [Sphingopyxis granuli]